MAPANKKKEKKRKIKTRERKEVFIDENCFGCDEEDGGAERLINIENYHHHQEIKGKSQEGEQRFYLSIFF